VVEWNPRATSSWRGSRDPASVPLQVSRRLLCWPSPRPPARSMARPEGVHGKAERFASLRETGDVRCPKPSQPAARHPPLPQRRPGLDRSPWRPADLHPLGTGRRGAVAARHGDPYTSSGTVTTAQAHLVLFRDSLLAANTGRRGPASAASSARIGRAARRRSGPLQLLPFDLS